MKREAGILLPISALPSPYGIGCFSREAYDLVDFLADCNQSLWQILPLCPTSLGDSPYQSPCSFAGNPYFISPDGLVDDGLLTNEECKHYSVEREGGIDYRSVYEKRYPLLRLAYERFLEKNDTDGISKFSTENTFWLEDFCLFMAIKTDLSGAPLSSWNTALRLRDTSALSEFRSSHTKEIGFHRFLQFKFFEQWKKLKDYANSKKISIVGDIPIYVSADSSDLWVHPDLFLLDRNRQPLAVAGCPPDGFTPKGQLWGNPIYDWNAHRESDFDWWKRRMEHACSMYDIVRIDHFRGFEAYYSIPTNAPDATTGHWEAGVGIELFRRAASNISSDRVIAEDLGYITDGVRALVKECGYPGMKILQFGFEDTDSDFRSEYLPHNYTENSVVYTGTHDNPTLCGWLESLAGERENMLRSYILDFSSSKEALCDKLIALAMQSISRLCIIPLQDYLHLDNQCRINTPSSSSGNWTWHTRREDFTEDLAHRIRFLTKIGGRQN